jgi:hypothetical protein
MKSFMRNPRTGLPTLAVFVALVLSFMPPFNSVMAAGSSSSMSSASSSPQVIGSSLSSGFVCDSTFSAGTVNPGDTVRGLLKLGNGCRFIGRVHLDLNGGGLDKSPDKDGNVSVSVKTNTDGKTAVLDDPTDVSVHVGRNTVEVTGPAQSSDGTTGSAEVDAFFDLQAVPTTAAPATVTPVALQSSGGGGSLARTGINLFALFLLALMAIALGTYTIASERSVPVTADGGVMAPAASLPLFGAPLGGAEQWTLELVILAAVSYILGPPPGRHARKDGPRGLVPAVREWLYPDE